MAFALFLKTPIGIPQKPALRLRQPLQGQRSTCYSNMRLQSYYDTFRVADRSSYLEDAVPTEDLLTVDYNNDMAGFLNDLHDLPDADSTIIADALQQTSSQGALAFMASLQNSGAIDAGSPAQPILSETVDYDRFFLAEHDIYGSSRLGMRQYLPRTGPGVTTEQLRKYR